MVRGWHAGPALGGVFRDAVHACRWSPGVSLGIVATLALALGANVAMYRVLDRLLLAPPAHVERPGEVQRIYVTQTYGERTWTQAVMTLPDVEALSKVEAFSEVAAEAQREVLFGRGEDALRVKAKIVGGNYFRLLGVAPLRGRFFDGDDDRLGAAPVAVLGYRFWRRAFGGSDDALGRELELGYGRYTVIGVAPRGFSGAGLEPVDLYVPLAPTAALLYDSDAWRTRNMIWLQAVARLAPGANPYVAEEAATLTLQHEQEEAGFGEMTIKASFGSLVPARGPHSAPEVDVSRWLGGVSAILLLIACANVANLLLVRGIRRRREVALRLTLGCGRGRLGAQLVLEGLLLAGVGCFAAIVLSTWGAERLRSVLLPDVGWSGLEQAPRIAAFGVVATLLAGGLVSLLPVLQLRRIDPGVVLKAGGAGSLGGGAAVRKGLVVLQTALSVALLIAAGLFVRSLARVRGVDVGMDMDRLVLLQLDADRRDLTAPESQELYLRAARRVERLPGVESAAIAAALPFRTARAVFLRAPGVAEPPHHEGGGPYVYSVSAGFAATSGLELRRGRFFTADEERRGAPVVVVGETMARLYWPGAEALGRCLQIGADDAPCSRVVGVAADARRFSIVDSPGLAYYVPLGTLGDDAPSALLARARPGASPAQIAGRARQEVLGAGDGLRAVEARPFDELLDPQRRSWRLGAVLFTLFGVLALVVAAVGLYGILAFEVAQRVPELGVRSALGATRPQLARLVLGRAVLWSGLGVVLGSALALAAGPRLAGLLFQTSPRDPAVMLLVVGVLLFVTFIAALLPARRATTVDPAQALRAQ